MNINKHSKLILSALLITPLALYLTGCSSSNSGDPVTDPTTGPVPTEGITGIWTGQLIRKDVPGQIPEDYEFDMLFYMPDDATRGQSVGSAFRTSPESYPANDVVEPHFLIKSGYEYVTDLTNDFGDLICQGDGWAIGRIGTHATFLREYAYEDGSQAGPEQRGAMCLTLDGNKLTGEFKTEGYGSFLVELTYSDQNLKSSSVNDLTSGGIDTEKYNLWSNDNAGTAMSFSQNALPGNSIDVNVVEDSKAGTAEECGGTVRITEIPGYNMFTLQTLDPHVEGCNYADATLPEYFYVDLKYSGLGTVSDADGTNKFIHLMGSIDNVGSAQAVYNVFTIY